MAYKAKKEFEMREEYVWLALIVVIIIVAPAVEHLGIEYTVSCAGYSLRH
jgi:hypothetical protein